MILKEVINLLFGTHFTNLCLKRYGDPIFKAGWGLYPGAFKIGRMFLFTSSWTYHQGSWAFR